MGGTGPWGAKNPTPLGIHESLRAVSGVAAPLLAGSSIALIGVIAADIDRFRWPGATLLTLLMATGLLVLSIQCAYFAQAHYWTPSDYRMWFDESTLKNETFRNRVEPGAKTMHVNDRREWERWFRRARRAFDAGISALFLATAGVLAPPLDHDDLQTEFRWFASLLALGFAIFEFTWSMKEVRKYSARGNDV